MLRIKLLKSLIGEKPGTRDNVKALGLGKVNSSVVHNDGPVVRGQLHRVRHLVSIEEVEGKAPVKKQVVHARKPLPVKRVDGKKGGAVKAIVVKAAKVKAEPKAAKPAAKPVAKKPVAKKEDK